MTNVALQLSLLVATSSLLQDLISLARRLALIIAPPRQELASRNGLALAPRQRPCRGQASPLVTRQNLPLLRLMGRFCRVRPRHDRTGFPLGSRLRQIANRLQRASGAAARSRPSTDETTATGRPSSCDVATRSRNRQAWSPKRVGEQGLRREKQGASCCG